MALRPGDYGSLGVCHGGEFRDPATGHWTTVLADSEVPPGLETGEELSHERLSG